MYRCPICTVVARFIEHCEADEGETKVAVCCDNCNVLVYIHTFDELDEEEE